MLVSMLCDPEECVDDGMEVERRAVVRYLCDREVIFSPLWTRDRLWARVRSISTDGIGLLLSAPIEQGTDLVLEMKTTEPGIALTVVARVVHSTMQEDGRWIVGCRFLTQPTEEQLLTLL